MVLGEHRSYTDFIHMAIMTKRQINWKNKTFRYQLAEILGNKEIHYTLELLNMNNGYFYSINCGETVGEHV